ncbi:hypothetical protein NL676_024352 [Syzygium grande]|nr:hypothetical protein NL676_024352 [Syzygium grande]
MDGLDGASVHGVAGRWWMSRGSWQGRLPAVVELMTKDSRVWRMAVQGWARVTASQLPMSRCSEMARVCKEETAAVWLLSAINRGASGHLQKQKELQRLSMTV